MNGAAAVPHIAQTVTAPTEDARLKGLLNVRFERAAELAVEGAKRRFPTLEKEGKTNDVDLGCAHAQHANVGKIGVKRAGFNGVVHCHIVTELSAREDFYRYSAACLGLDDFFKLVERDGVLIARGTVATDTHCNGVSGPGRRTDAESTDRRSGYARLDETAAR